MNSTEHNVTGAQFKTLRESLGLSAQWVANQIGVQLRTVQYWEVDRMKVPADAYQVLVDVDKRLSAQVAQTMTGYVQENIQKYKKAFPIPLIRYRNEKELYVYEPAFKDLPLSVHITYIERLKNLLSQDEVNVFIGSIELSKYKKWLLKSDKIDTTFNRGEYLRDYYALLSDEAKRGMLFAEFNRLCNGNEYNQSPQNTVDTLDQIESFKDSSCPKEQLVYFHLCYCKTKLVFLSNDEIRKEALRTSLALWQLGDTNEARLCYSSTLNYIYELCFKEGHFQQSDFETYLIKPISKFFQKGLAVDVLLTIDEPSTDFLMKNITSPDSYIFHGSDIYYFNKSEKYLNKMTFNKEETAEDLKKALNPSTHPRPLSNSELKSIRDIIEVIYSSKIDISYTILHFFIDITENEKNSKHAKKITKIIVKEVFGTNCDDASPRRYIHKFIEDDVMCNSIMQKDIDRTDREKASALAKENMTYKAYEYKISPSRINKDTLTGFILSCLKMVSAGISYDNERYVMTSHAIKIYANDVIGKDVNNFFSMMGKEVLLNSMLLSDLTLSSEQQIRFINELDQRSLDPYFVIEKQQRAMMHGITHGIRGNYMEAALFIAPYLEQLVRIRAGAKGWDTKDRMGNDKTPNQEASSIFADGIDSKLKRAIFGILYSLLWDVPHIDNVQSKNSRIGDNMRNYFFHGLIEDDDLFSEINQAKFKLIWLLMLLVIIN